MYIYTYIASWLVLNYTVHRKIFGTGKIGKFGKLWGIHQNFPSQIHQNVFSICTDCSLFAKFFLSNSFYLYDSPKFSYVRYTYRNLLKLESLTSGNFDEFRTFQSKATKQNKHTKISAFTRISSTFLSSNSYSIELLNLYWITTIYHTDNT